MNYVVYSMKHFIVRVSICSHFLGVSSYISECQDVKRKDQVTNQHVPHFGERYHHSFPNVLHKVPVGLFSPPPAKRASARRKRALNTVS